MRTEKQRIDRLLVDGGFADSRNKARALIMAGVVLVNENRVEKPSQTFPVDSKIRIKTGSNDSRYVGRGGIKLESALRVFKIDVKGLRCLDIGSSTGGFTDCLLQFGADTVVAVDAGTNQLDWKLRSDLRVTVRERTNARGLTPGDFSHPFDLVVIDVSFISVTKILIVVPPLLTPSGKVIVLIKPQFEVGKGEVGKGGVVRDPNKHQAVVQKVLEYAARIGLRAEGVIDSPILGAEGNKEFLALFERA